MSVRVYLCLCACIHVCMNMGICIYACMHACICLPVCVCVGILLCVEKQPLFLHLPLNVGVQMLVCNLFCPSTCSRLSHCSGTVTPILCPAHTSYRVFGPHPPNEFPYFSNGHFLLNASWSLGLSKSTCQNINFIHPQHTTHTHMCAQQSRGTQQI